MLLNLSGVRKSFADNEILSGVSFRVERREKVALLGRNGSGKTTFLRIITGQLEPDGGSVQLARGAKIGYLRQEAPVDPSKTVLEEAEDSRKEALAIKSKLELLEQRLNSPEALEEYATLHEHYMELEGYSAERDLRTVLGRMGFSDDELAKPVSALSGGEKTRLALARLLLEQPDLLLLDEPTNHLDLNATEWLEGWLRQYPGAVLVVSHDRAFLNGFGDRILDLRDGCVKTYPGPFEKFLRVREEEEIRLAEVAKRQQQEIDKLDEYVRRFMNSQRTAQARGRQKQMEKLISSAVSVRKADKGLKASFANSKRSGDIALEVRDAAIAFGPRTLFRDLSWTVRYGERWGIVGENGAGKSTLVKFALGLLGRKSAPSGNSSSSPEDNQLMAGTARLGSNVSAGYFAQDTVSLNPDQSPLDMMVWEYNLLPADARNLLARFLITGDEVYRPIKTLSGGEKNKLVLAGLTTLNPNLLVLDEPTNHLDLDSREALAQILREFNGTLILVSHDRWLLEQVTDHTLDLRRTGPTFFNGSYGDYRRSQDGASFQAAAKAKTPVPQPTPNGKPELSPRELSKEIVRLENLVLDIEAEVHASERELAGIEQQLAELPPNADILGLTRQHASVQEHIAGRIAAWEEQSTKLEELRKTRSSG